MKTKTNATQGRRIAAVAGLIALAGWGAGCATTGGAEAQPVAAQVPAAKTGPTSVGAADATSGTGEAGAAGAAATAASAGKGDFYADWYDASAVVLPPPPVAAGRR